QGEVVENTTTHPQGEVVENTTTHPQGEVVENTTTHPQGEVVEITTTHPQGEVAKNLNNLPYLKTFRKNLRNNLTPAEAKLWTLLKGKQLENKKFRRQFSVANYILDFYCPAEHLAIELDGQGHFEASQAQYDYERDLFLNHCGIKVLRFENKWVWENPEGLLEVIKENFGWKDRFDHSVLRTAPLTGEQLESGAELLKRIKAEKAKSGKKEKPLPPIQPEEIPFEIPENWVWCRLGEICEINPRNKIDDNLDAGFIPMPMVSQLFGIKPTYEIRKWGSIKKGFTHFANNDVVVAKITPCFENSKAGIISDLPNGIGAGTTELNVLRGNKFVLPEYIYAFVKRIDFLKNGERIMKGVAGQQRVPTEYFYNTPIPLPPLSEQKRIVAEIEKQFALTQQLKEKVLANQQATEQLLKALLHQAFEVQ
ncbi:MAG: DUF559 domain-containing protein, partial [Bacteroidia bacterium]|nr:DUF559 domain-containing protein [Bacteroidia bacterium]